MLGPSQKHKLLRKCYEGKAARIALICKSSAALSVIGLLAVIGMSQTGEDIESSAFAQDSSAARPAVIANALRAIQPAVASNRSAWKFTAPSLSLISEARAEEARVEETRAFDEIMLLRRTSD